MLSLSEEELNDHPSVKDIESRKRVANSPKFEFHMFSETEVAKSLANLNPSKTAGHDRISPRILLTASTQLAPSLTRIFNKCIEDRHWPTEWKRGDWVAVYKKDDQKDIKNYRPVTALTAVDKVFEQLLCTQVSNYIEPYLNRSLTAYRKKNSCETTLIKLVKGWKMSLDNKDMVGVLSTDLSKAFDSLHPMLLLAKLKAYGFNDSAIRLLRSYFSERKKLVKIGMEFTSEWKTVLGGCPQGSNFGPLLRNIFQNDLVFNINNSGLTMYADDHQMYSHGERMEDVEKTLTVKRGNIFSVGTRRIC